MSENGMTESERIGHYMEMWKQATQVNQHFNDIEWRIRGLALTVATFILGAAGFAAREHSEIWGISLGTLVLVIGLLLWYAFYFVDMAWYHQLLKASVDHTSKLEAQIRTSLPLAGLSDAITEGSAYTPNRLVRRLAGTNNGEMRSGHKLKWFYKVGAFALGIVAVALQAYSMAGDTPAREPTNEVVVRLEGDAS